VSRGEKEKRNGELSVSGAEARHGSTGDVHSPPVVGDTKAEGDEEEDEEEEEINQDESALNDAGRERRKPAIFESSVGVAGVLDSSKASLDVPLVGTAKRQRKGQ
jgi:hypothetical protein